MMIVAFIFSICILQLSLYRLADKLMLPVKLTILIALAIAYIAVFPQFYDANNEQSGIINRLFKNLVSHLALIVFGIVSIIFTHIAYLIAKIPKRPGA